MTAGIKWQEPPAERRGRAPWDEIAEALRGRPGAWALVGENIDASQATRIKKGGLSAFAPAGSFEAVTRKNEGDKHDIYARYVGEVSP